MNRGGDGCLIWAAPSSRMQARMEQKRKEEQAHQEAPPSPALSLPLLFLAAMKGEAFPHYTFLLWCFRLLTSLSKRRASWSWTETSETGRQDKSFLFKLFFSEHLPIHSLCPANPVDKKILPPRRLHMQEERLRGSWAQSRAYSSANCGVLLVKAQA